MIAAGVAVLAAVVAASRARTAGTRRLVLARFPAVPAHSRNWRALAPPPWFHARLAAAAIPVEAGRAWRWWGVTIACAAIAALVAPTAGALAVAMCTLAPVAVLWWRRDRGHLRYERTFPEVLDAVAAAVRSGSSLRDALREAPGDDLGAELRALAALAARGVPLAEAVRGWSGRTASPSERLVATALVLATATGGPPARALDGTIRSLRARRAAIDDARAMAAQARLSGLVIALAPAAFAVLLAAVDPDTASFLIATPLGLAILATGIALDIAGAVWMARLTAPPAW